MTIESCTAVRRSDEFEAQSVCYAGKYSCAGITCDDCVLHRPDRRVGERRKARRLTFRERRDGFDRRSAVQREGLIERALKEAAVNLRSDNRTLLLLLILFCLLNFADYFFTLRALSAGHAEANPIMAALFGMGPVAAGLFKMGIALSICVFIWLFRKFKLILQAAVLGVLTYGGLMAYHLLGLLLLG